MTDKEQFDLVVKPSAGNIVSNLSDLETWVKSVTEPYIGQVVTDDQTKFAKKDLADLRKLKTALEDERKKAKAIIMEPYTQFEAMYKKAVSSLDEAIFGIDKQIKEIEALSKQRREEELKAFILEAAEKDFGKRIHATVSRPDVMSWFFDQKWLNATAAKTTTERTIREKLLEMVRAIDSIETAAGDDAAAALDVYYSTGSLSAAILKKSQLDEIRKVKAAAKTSAEAVSETESQNAPCHQSTETPYLAPVADRIFFDIPLEPEDEAQKELMHIPTVLVFPRYKMHLLKEIMSKLGIKIMKPSSKEAC